VPHADSLSHTLRRAFWFACAAALIIGALIGIAAILRGEISETDWKILGTLGSLLLAGATAVAGLSLIEPRKMPGLGWTAVGCAAVGFFLLVAALWNEFDAEGLAKLAATSAIVLPGMLLATTGRILLRAPKLLVVWGLMLVAVAAAVLVSVAAVWDEDLGEGVGKAIATLWILAVLGWLLVPVIQRFFSVGAAEADSVRVLGQLDGVELVAARGPVEGVPVASPAPGERLVLRPRR
jgi:hypothetical protein